VTAPYHHRAADKARMFAAFADDLIREHQLREQQRREQNLQQRLQGQPMAQAITPPDEQADIAKALIRRLAIKDKGR
jgi:hypothetical protein